MTPSELRTLLEQAWEDGWWAAWDASGEGCNAEYTCDEEWVRVDDERKAALAEWLRQHPEGGNDV